MQSTEKHIAVSRTARFFQVGELNANTRRLWIVLHGYGQMGSFFIKHFEHLAEEGDCIVAPEALSRFYLDGKWDRVGATWMTKEDRLHEISDYVAYLDAVLDAVLNGQNAPEVVLLGFSQGATTAWRWLMKGKVRPQQFIMWAGGVATDALENAHERLANCGLHFVLGDTDQYVTMENAQKQLASLKEIKPDARLWAFNGDHRMDPPTLNAIIDSWT